MEQSRPEQVVRERVSLGSMDQSDDINVAQINKIMSNNDIHSNDSNEQQSNQLLL